MPAVTEWVRHALFDLGRVALELGQLQTRVHHVVTSSPGTAESFEQRRHAQLVGEALERMDAQFSRAHGCCRALSRALPVSGTDALEATRCLQLARDARKAIKRLELDDDRRRRVLVDAQLDCFRRLRAVRDDEREVLKAELESLSRERRAQELRLIRRAGRLAVLVGKRLAVAGPVAINSHG